MKLQEKKDMHYNLVYAIKEHGLKEPKRHGDYFTVNVFDKFQLHLDTWNKAITVLKDGKRYDYLGMDFGGFDSKTDMVKFWFGHKCLFSKPVA